jgi:hypothetical protein
VRSKDEDNSRSLLKARIAEISSQRRAPDAAHSIAASMPRPWLSAFLALVIVAAGGWAVRETQLGSEPSGNPPQSVKQLASFLPRRQLTPGAARAIQIEELCRSQYLQNDPAVQPSLELAVFREYGLPASSKSAYQLDYLITPALGGTADIQNLWPQPYSATWNAGTKDQLEDHLHHLVCEGKLELATAQNEIASDWIAAYQRYFKTDGPLPGETTAATDWKGESEPASVDSLRPRTFDLHDALARRNQGDKPETWKDRAKDPEQEQLSRDRSAGVDADVDRRTRSAGQKALVKLVQSGEYDRAQNRAGGGGDQNRGLRACRSLEGLLPAVKEGDTDDSVADEMAGLADQMMHLGPG